MKRVCGLIFLVFFAFFNCLAQTQCDRKLPTSFSELNQFSPLIYNLSENCNYQPLHIEISEADSFTIIGRFNGYKQDEKYNLRSIEFAFYEASFEPKTILVNRAWINEEQSRNGFTVINIELIDITNCNSSNCATLREKKLNGENDFVFETSVLSFSKNDTIDFHIINLNGVSQDASKGFFPRGRHCNGVVIF